MSGLTRCIQFGQERPFVTYSGSKVYNPWVARGHVATPAVGYLGRMPAISAIRLHFTALSASIRVGAPTSVPCGNCIGAMGVDTVYGRSLKPPSPRAFRSSKEAPTPKPGLFYLSRSAERWPSVDRPA